MCERVGGVAWPGTEAVERGADSQGHSGMGGKGQMWSCGQWEPREVCGQGGDTTLTCGAHTECSCEWESLGVGCPPDLLSTGPQSLVHIGVTWGLDANAEC